MIAFQELKTHIKNKFEKSPKTFQCQKPTIALIKQCNDPIVLKMIEDCNADYRQVCYCIINDIDEIPKCPHCGKTKVFQKMSKGYRKTCGNIECYRKSASETNIERYGAANVFASEEIKGRIKQSNLEKYGVEYAQQSDIIKDKTIATNLERYGVETPFLNKDIKRRAEETIIKNNGGIGYSSESIKQKAHQTTRERHGSEHVLRIDSFRDHFKQVSIERYGVDIPFKSKEVQERWKQNIIKKYGVDHPMKTESCVEKMKATNMERYGVDNYSKTEEYKQKYRETCLRLYGVDNYSKTEESKQKSRNTCLEKYGEISYTKTEECKEKIKNTNLKRYGTPSALTKIKIDSAFRHLNESLKDSTIEMLFTKEDWKGYKSIYKWRCKECGQEFESPIRYPAPICRHCHPITISSGQLELINFIKSIYDGEIVVNTRKIIAPKEIDVYLPELKIGFEFNGTWWHSLNFNKNNKYYHYDKTEQCFSKGILLYHVFEFEWFNYGIVIQDKIARAIYRQFDSELADEIVLDRTWPQCTPKELLNAGYVLSDCIPPSRIVECESHDLFDCGKMIFKKLKR